MLKVRKRSLIKETHVNPGKMFGNTCANVEWVLEVTRVNKNTYTVINRTLNIGHKLYKTVKEKSVDCYGTMTTFTVIQY